MAGPCLIRIADGGEVGAGVGIEEEGEEAGELVEVGGLERDAESSSPLEEVVGGLWVIVYSTGPCISLFWTPTLSVRSVGSGGRLALVDPRLRKASVSASGHRVV